MKMEEINTVSKGQEVGGVGLLCTSFWKGIVGNGMHREGVATRRLIISDPLALPWKQVREPPGSNGY